MASETETCLKEEKKMVGFMADMLLKVMVLPDIDTYFTFDELNTMRNIRRHFVDRANYVMLSNDEKNEKWNETSD